MQRFARVEIYTMALGLEKHRPHSQRKKSNHTPKNDKVSSPSYMQIFTTCFAEINSFLEFMINTSSVDYRRLPFSEWGMLSITMIYFHKLCQPQISDINKSTFYIELVQTESAIWIKGIGRLCDRLEEVSSTTTTQENTCGRRIPDFFYLFNTVLKLFKENFVRDSMTTQTSQEREQEQGSSCRRNTSRSQCPVMNGDIQHTDYWDMLMSDTQNYLEDTMGCSGAEADFDINDPAYFDLASWLDISM